MSERLSSVPTPRVVIDRGKVRSNIAAMQALATRAGVRLRPHAKTHKSPVIAGWQIEAGAAGVCCAKPGEAEVFADAGVTDIRLPYPVNPANANRILALMDRVRLSIIVDDVNVAREWSQAMNAAGRKLDVLIKVDVGSHRCGIDPESPRVISTIKQIADLSGLRLLGLLSHAGHGYGARDEAELEQVAEREIAILRSLAAQALDAGVELPEISVGATPTARFFLSDTGATEMRPGTYVFFDRTQIGLGAATLDQCAMTVISTVVSRPAGSRVVFDAGSKTLSSDVLRGFGPTSGYGLVFPQVDGPDPDPSIVIERLSEEHAVARVPPSCRLKPGDRVRIIPNHTCVVTNLTDELLVVDGSDDVVDRLPVAARGRIW
jgi:D-serine deaminase-like pyridoxal phosphate-dependent protein